MQKRLGGSLGVGGKPASLSNAAPEIIGECQHEHDDEPDSPGRRLKPEQRALPEKAHKKQEPDQCHEDRDESVYGCVVAPSGAKAAPKEMPRKMNSPFRIHSR